MERERRERTGAGRPVLLAVLIAAAGAALAPAPAGAQEAGSDALEPRDGPPSGPVRSGPELDLSAVFLTPLSDLEGGTATRGALQLSTGAGLRGGALWWLGSRVAVGVGAVWTPADVDRQPVAGDDGSGGGDPGGEVGRADYAAGTAELVLAFPSVGRDVRVEPYVVAGAGVRRLSIEASDDAAGDELPDDLTDPLATVGGGFRMRLSEHLLVRLEARDQVASAEIGSEGRIQHDLTVSMGLGLRP